MSPEERRARIAWARRRQPLAELRRKARKADGKHGGGYEAEDLLLVEIGAHPLFLAHGLCVMLPGRTLWAT